MMDQILRKNKKTLWKRIMISGASREASFIEGHGINQENYMCLEKNHFLFQ